MGVKFPEPYCNYHSPSGSHHYLKIADNIWQCKYCWAVMWLPNNWDDCEAFGIDVMRMGIDKAYQKQLRNRPGVRQVLSTLTEISQAREVMPEDELIKVVADIVTSRDFEEDSELDRPYERVRQDMTFERIF